MKYAPLVDKETVERSFHKSDIHEELKKTGIPKPSRHKSQGKGIKHALYWKRGKRPTDKAPRGFIARTPNQETAFMKSLFGFA